MRALAAAIDQPASTVAHWLKHPEWPFARHAPWRLADAPAMLRWAASSLERSTRQAAGGAGVRGQIAELRVAKLKQEHRKLCAQADKLETELAVYRGQLHDAAACEAEAVRRAGLVRVALQNLPSQAISVAIGHGLPHEAAPVYQQQLQEMVDAALARLAASAEQSPDE